MKKAAEIVCLPDRANISPYSRSYIRVLEALLVEYFTWVFEGDAELRQMPSDIFVNEMGAANVFAWGAATPQSLQTWSRGCHHLYSSVWCRNPSHQSIISGATPGIGVRTAMWITPESSLFYPDSNGE